MLSGNFLRYQNIPDHIIIFCYFKLKFWLELIHNLSLASLWILSDTKKEFRRCKECCTLDCEELVCDNLYIILKLCLKVFPSTRKYFSLTKTNLLFSVFFSALLNVPITQNLKCEDCCFPLKNKVEVRKIIYAIWIMFSWGFVRGHKNMSHICKWRKIVLIIKGLEQISVGRRENTQKLCDDG